MLAVSLSKSPTALHTPQRAGSTGTERDCHHIAGHTVPGSSPSPRRSSWHPSRPLWRRRSPRGGPGRANHCLPATPLLLPCGRSEGTVAGRHRVSKARVEQSPGPHPSLGSDLCRKAELCAHRQSPYQSLSSWWTLPGPWAKDHTQLPPSASACLSCLSSTVLPHESALYSTPKARGRGDLLLFCSLENGLEVAKGLSAGWEWMLTPTRSHGHSDVASCHLLHPKKPVTPPLSLTCKGQGSLCTRLPKHVTPCSLGPRTTAITLWTFIPPASS